MKRAMTDSAKAEKARLILDAALDLYKRGTFEEIKMSDIARAAKVSKGTMFYYYSTKETLFMEIMFLEYEKRFADFERLLLPVKSMTYAEFKRFFLKEMESILDLDSVLIRLIAIKSTVLEKNIDYETTLKVSLGLFRLLEKIVGLLTERVEGIEAEAYYELLQAQSAIMVGYANAASMPEAMQQVVTEHKMDGFRVDFAQNSLQAMAYYLDGVYARQQC
ncbi:TetR/AcrR family transcriptional regulator [Saccharibacillus sp. CPCC 101409]|uniref:TetR/AcrR family transcriptional regulator n=1 Tax=Saccharibacillus sp. CPCC 101409 TaxID=3058041 RepID=UPI00267169C3|nr:TetR/AcrR family transcriptional regulator [Saccharibacillus sp. CPCC 101409]MDO3410567.1 TetR/AcrR family transcriptional regulator [Saccharibacillus sp. CPCC 101409]